MDELKHGLLLVGIVAAIFSLFAAEVWWRRGRSEGIRAAGWLLLALVVLFGVEFGFLAMGALWRR
jgi:hypothetical protein